MTHPKECWRTGDGRVFEDEASAEEHQEILDIEDAINKLIPEDESKSWDTGDLIAYMAQNPEAFIEALGGEVTQDERA